MSRSLFCFFSLILCFSTFQIQNQPQLLKKMSSISWKGCFLILISVILVILYIIPTTMLRAYRFSFPTIQHSKSLSVSLIQTGIYPRSTKFSHFAFNDLSQPLLLTMADGYYSSAIENLHFKLREYNLQRNFIVLCLDTPCLNLCRSKQILSWSGFSNVSVANLKVSNFHS